MAGKGQGKGARGARGMAMPLVLVATAILAASLTGLFGVLAVPLRSARAAHEGELAFYAAEAGVHHAVALTLGYKVWKCKLWNRSRTLCLQPVTESRPAGLDWCRDPSIQGRVFQIEDSSGAFSTVVLYQFSKVQYNLDRCWVEVYGYPDILTSFAAHCLAAWIQYDATQNKVRVQYDLCQEG